MHKTSLYYVVTVTIFYVKVKYKSSWPKNMIYKFIKCKSCRNRKLCIDGQPKIEKMVLAAIFCFAYLKAKGTKSRMLSNRFEFSTPKYYVKTSALKY